MKEKLEFELEEAWQNLERAKELYVQIKLDWIRHIYNIGVGDKFVSKGYGWSYAKGKECEIIAIFPEKEIIEVKLVGTADRFRMGRIDLQRQFA